MPGWLRPRLRVAEASLFLTLARLLIALVPLKYWRRSLGRVATVPVKSQGLVIAGHVANAVQRATQHLPLEMVCLPRAMAVQWMLRRRRLPSALVFGILPQRDSGDLHALHAWVEAGGQIVIGADPTRTYRPGLTLVQP